jgi:hypothetical protein
VAPGGHTSNDVTPPRRDTTPGAGAVDHTAMPSGERAPTDVAPPHRDVTEGSTMAPDRHPPMGGDVTRPSMNAPVHTDERRAGPSMMTPTPKEPPHPMVEKPAPAPHPEAAPKPHPEPKDKKDDPHG